MQYNELGNDSVLLHFVVSNYVIPVSTISFYKAIDN